MEMLEYDQSIIDVLYTLCNRDMAQEALAAIPFKDQPTKEYLESYIPRSRQVSEDLAWGEYYPQLVAWLSDREDARRRKESQD